MLENGHGGETRIDGCASARLPSTCSPKPAPAGAVYRGAQLAELLTGRPPRKVIALRLDESAAGEIVSVPCGEMVVLNAATGAGKSSLALQIAWVHARTTGPAICMSLELDADIVAARVVGQRCGAAWMDVLAGKVDKTAVEAVFDPPRLLVMDRAAAGDLDQLKLQVAELQGLYPDEPILVVLDYLQIMPAALESGDSRTGVSRETERVRSVVKETGVVAIVVSQVSREAARRLDNSNNTGNRTTDAGAESSQIERAAFVTLAITGREAIDSETRRLGLSIGKYRMGDGDREIPMEFNGRTGLFKIGGKSETSAAVRTRNKSKILADRVVEVAQARPAGFSNATQLAEAVGGNRQTALRAIREELLPGGRLERVGQRGLRFQVPVP